MACPICIENITEDEEVKELPCKHQYHIECINQWIAQKNKHVICPVCRWEDETSRPPFEPLHTTIPIPNTVSQTTIITPEIFRCKMLASCLITLALVTLAVFISVAISSSLNNASNRFQMKRWNFGFN